MLILDNTTDSLEVILGGAITTNQLDCTASFREITTTTFEPRTFDISTNGSTAVTLVSAPAASTQRVIDEVSIFNTDTVNAIVTVRYNRNGTFRRQFQTTLAPNEKLQYTDKNGWAVYATTGAIKQSINQGANASSSNWSTLALNTDVVNNNAIANTLQDVTGLAFPVVAGETYEFIFRFWFNSQALTTGSRWTLNGPSFTTLSYETNYTATTTTTTVAQANAYQLPAAANPHVAFLNGNNGIIQGKITASVNGSVQLQFASEVANSAITALAGSTVEWRRVL